MRIIFACVFFLTSWYHHAQLIDNFGDGDFSTNPVWTGTTADYMINAGFELQLNNTIAATSYLSTAHGLADLNNKEWKFWTKQSFAPSGSNYGRVYLTASSADLLSNPDGFYLQFGEAGSLDAVRLFKSQGGSSTELLAGPAAQIAASFVMGVRVVRDNAGNWSLYLDAAGGESYTLAGTVNDATPLLGSHFGFVEVYTVSNITKFYHDNIYVGNEILDVDPPQLTTATAISANQVDITFNEAVEEISCENTANYDLIPFNSIALATRDAINPALVHLDLTTSLVNGNSYQLTTINIEDLSGNISGTQTIDFSYLIAETPSAGDVVINEFMADPSPPVFLPEFEYVEIYNRSNKIFNVSNWKLFDNASSGNIASAWLLPGGYITLTPTSSAGSFTNGVGVTSFPSLNNADDAIVLKTELGLVLDSIYYTTDWYQDPAKEDGGYSIERINPMSPCSNTTNWRASESPDGGTPGEVNSVLDATPDTSAPGLSSLFAMTPNLVNVIFNEGMDSTSLADAIITTNPVLTIQSRTIAGTYPQSVLLTFVENLTPSVNYAIDLQAVADCWQNSTSLLGYFTLPEVADSGDVVINELMFNPLTGGTDFVEIYNQSDKVIDLFNWSLANYENGPSDLETITSHVILLPNDYLVFSEDSTQILQNYPASIPGKFHQMNLPSYNNDSSTVILLQDNLIRDAVGYSEDWHFVLLDDPKGKSLERIDPEGKSNDQHNWHTAAEAIGFATPGRLNSQYSDAVTDGELTYTSEVISPDNDGFEDVLQINYLLTEPGLVGTFSVYDDRGRLIAEVIKSELLAMEGSFNWDGIRTNGTKASIGIYAGVFEVFSTDGEVVYTEVKAFTVAGKI